jgi:hypothetical protein
VKESKCNKIEYSRPRVAKGYIAYEEYKAAEQDCVVQPFAGLVQPHNDENRIDDKR